MSLKLVDPLVHIRENSTPSHLRDKATETKGKRYKGLQQNCANISLLLDNLSFYWKQLTGFCSRLLSRFSQIPEEYNKLHTFS